jgi:LmbE family N-acetylglucosaminyl deacetylase/SAM-dependent methyltransferase
VVLVVGAGEPRAFTHVGPGTPATGWQARPEWTAGEPLSLAGVTRLVVVAAHPDDESLGAGGLIATATRLGLPVEIVCATDGEGSHPDSPTRTPEELALVRVHEGRLAAHELGAPDPHRLGLPDGSVADHHDDLTRRLVELVGDGRGEVIVAPWRHDGHPDHEAAGRAAAAAARRTGADLWEYPVWFWHWGDPADAPWSRLHPFGLDEHATHAKLAAIGAHASQVAPLSDLEGDGILLSADLLAHFVDGPEHYLRTASVDAPDDSLDRLHEEEPDPWGVETRWYEQRKRDLLLAMLPRERFGHALEVGSSTGALAEALSGRSDRVLAVDRSPAALASARARFQFEDHVTVLELDVPHEWPDDLVCDLVVVSEVGYFLSPAELDVLVQRIAGSLAPDGVLVLCHWRHRVEGWVLEAEDVHRRFEDSGLPPVQATYRDQDVEIRVHAPQTSWPDPTR